MKKILTIVLSLVLLTGCSVVKDIFNGDLDKAEKYFTLEVGEDEQPYVSAITSKETEAFTLYIKDDDIDYLTYSNYSKDYVYNVTKDTYLDEKRVEELENLADLHDKVEKKDYEIALAYIEQINVLVPDSVKMENSTVKWLKDPQVIIETLDKQKDSVKKAYEKLLKKADMDLEELQNALLQKYKKDKK